MNSEFFLQSPAYRVTSQNSKKRRTSIYYGMVAVFVAMFVAVMLAERTMPYAEGWYTYYAQLINRGELVYKDFEYLFTPFYIYFIALITKIFGYKIIILRLLGVFMFGCLAAALFYTLSRIFSASVAMVSTIVAVLYLQAEVAQVFYDYVRLMDIFAVLASGLLIKALGQIRGNDKYKSSLALAGLCTGIFVLIKQNMGLIFWAYVMVLIGFTGIYYRKKFRDVVQYYIVYNGPLIAVIALVVLALAMNGSLKYFLESSSSGAIEAKGGLFAILFNWIIKGGPSFVAQLPKAIVILSMMFIMYYLNHVKYIKKKKARKIGGLVEVFFAVAVIAGVLIFMFRGELAIKYVESREFISPYLIFDVIFTVFIILGIMYLCRLKGAENFYSIFALAGCYFAISYGCGTSGGLAEGQASIGVALLVAIILTLLRGLYCRRKQFNILVGLAHVIMCYMCVSVALLCVGRKMVSTYNWWGMTESNYWESHQRVTDIPLLQGIKLSESTLNVYSEIYEKITENTSKEDTIFCFPQIPIFYSICERWEPGTYSKVQWFDVSTNETIMNDIEILKENPPKAILIYNTSEDAYSSHESSFNKGEISATRIMREFLLNYAWEQGYTHYGNYISEGNVLSLWIIEDAAKKRVPIFDGGVGTAEEPYLISTKEQLIAISELVSLGRSFGGQYIQLATDIDMSGCDNFKPIGEMGSSCYFEGILNGNGYVISNLNIESTDGNVGLFGALGGEVYNLGLININVRGACCGTIASHASSAHARIANCYVFGTVNAYRAGGIVDNFCGKIENCYFSGMLVGNEANASSYPQGVSYMRDVYIDEESATKESMELAWDERVTTLSRNYMQTKEFCNVLNANRGELIRDGVEFAQWEIGDSRFPQLVTID